jgi:hypothetical protein
MPPTAGWIARGFTARMRIVGRPRLGARSQRRNSAIPIQALRTPESLAACVASASISGGFKQS